MSNLDLFFDIVHVFTDILVTIFTFLIFGSLIKDKIRKWRK